MINKQDKQRIEKEAEVYTVSVESRGCSFWQGMYRGYVAGATAELERSEKLLQQANDMANSAHSYTEGAESDDKYIPMIETDPRMVTASLRGKIRKERKENESLKQSLREIKECALGVGDGSGQHFVHGDYESVKLRRVLYGRK